MVGSSERSWSGISCPIRLEATCNNGKTIFEPIDGSDPCTRLGSCNENKDAEAALSILRLIRQKNPSDKNAVVQLVKIESSVQAKKIKNLLSQIKNNKDNEFSASAVFEMEPWESSPESLNGLR